MISQGADEYRMLSPESKVMNWSAEPTLYGQVGLLLSLYNGTILGHFNEIPDN